MLPQEDNAIYDVSLITKDLEEFELPALNIDLPEISTKKQINAKPNSYMQNSKKKDFDFSDFMSQTNESKDQKQDIKRFLNEHFVLVKDLSENQ